MSAIKVQAVKMAAIFAGNDDRFYTADFMNSQLTADGKLVPTYDICRRAPTVEDFERHLAGRLGILGRPINAASVTRWGAIDEDNYPVDAKAYARKIAQLKLPLLPQLTKSGGLHMFNYRPTAIPASEMREKLIGWASDLNCPARKVEIFPKQDLLVPGDDASGSGINLPYFGGEKAKNYAIGPDGRRLTVDEYLAAVEVIRAMPDKAPHHEGIVSVEAAADLLAQHWTDGRRDNLNIAAAGAMLRAGVDEGKAQEILDAARSAGADMESRRSVTDIARSKDAGKMIPGFPRLVELLGRDVAQEFMRLCGAKAPPDPLPITIQPLDLSWTYERLPPQEYIVQPLVPQKCVTLLIAEGGAGKTTFALHAAVAVATGRPLFGMPTMKGAIGYVGREDNAESVRRRVYQIVNAERERMRREGASPEAIDEFDSALAANFCWAAAVGIQMHLVSTMGGEVQQTSIIESLYEKLPSPLSLLILDPLARFQGGDENSNSVATGLMDAAELLAQKAGCAVLMPHHTGKAAAKERDPTQYAARGASALVDSSRSAIRLMVATAEDATQFANVPPEVIAAGDLVTVAHVKNSMGKRADPFHLRRQELGFELFVPTRDGGKARDDRLLTALYSWWCATERRPITRKRFDEAEVRAAAFGPGVTRDKAKAVLEDALAAGVLVAGEVAKHAHVAGYVFADGYDPSAVL